MLVYDFGFLGLLMYIIPRGSFWFSLFYTVTFRLVYIFQPYRFFHHHLHGGTEFGYQFKHSNISHCKYTLEDFRHIYRALISPILISRNHHTFSSPSQSKVTTLPGSPSSVLIMDGQSTVNPYMVVAPSYTTNIFLLVLGGDSYSL